MLTAGEPSVSGDVATTATTATVTVAAREGQKNEGGEASAAAAAAGIFGSSNSGEEEDNNNNNNNNKGRVLDGGFGGNRWPRQETLALLKIRSDLDVAFRDASVKGPLWDEVSRKLGELGYNRSAKKCKEKFENVFKYHKRTKDGRISKGQGKTYRFFDQLEAFQHHHHHHPSSLHQSPSSPSPSPKPHHQLPVVTAAAAVSIAPMQAANNPPPITTVPSTTTHITSIAIPSFPSTTTNPTIILPQATNIINNPTTIIYPSQGNNIPPPPLFHNNISTDLLSNSTSSSSTSSDLELEGRARRKKRKWREVFERLMKEVVDKQEELQRKFLEAIEKREHERMVREEAWRVQEMTRINREREILAQERSIAAAKDAAVMAFLQKLAEQQQNPSTGCGQVILSNNILPQILPQPITPASAPAPTPIPSQLPPPQPVFSMEKMKTNNGEPNNNNYMAAAAISSSRWPKVEVEALIKLRKDLDTKYQENGPKGPLWEEISSGMRRLGYSRSSKRCKEKWENINKYFKKVKESNKKRPEDSKTCPYFQQLDALYREKNKHDSSASNQLLFKPENSVPLMVRPEQQWPPPPPPPQLPEHHQQQRQDDAMEDIESDQNVEEDDKDGGDDDDYDDDDDDYDDDEDVGGGGFEIAPNKQVNSTDANE